MPWRWTSTRRLTRSPTASSLRWSIGPDSETIWFDGLWHTFLTGRHPFSTIDALHHPPGAYWNCPSFYPALFKPFMSDWPITDSDLTSYTEDFTLLGSSPSIEEAYARANIISTDFWEGQVGSNWPLFLRNLAWRWILTSLVSVSGTLDTHQSWNQPQVWICDEVDPLNWTPKILGVMLDTRLNFSPHALDYVEWASRARNIMKVLLFSRVDLGIRSLCAPS